MVLEKNRDWVKSLHKTYVFRDGEIARALVINPPNDGLCGPVSLAFISEIAGLLCAFTPADDIFDPAQIGIRLQGFAGTEKARELRMPGAKHRLLDAVYNNYHGEGINSYKDYR
jgi:hypothetical protein